MYMLQGLFGKKRVYMDFASSSPVHEDVIRAMNDALRSFGNPSAPHTEGREARELLENARTSVARSLAVKPESIYFTGSGTESNNLAVYGVVEALVERGAKYSDLHIISTSFEHPSLLEPLRHLETKGVSVTYLDPTPEGIVTAEMVKEHVTEKTILVSVVAVQSEIGAIQPLKEIAHTLESFRSARKQKVQNLIPESLFPIFHTDASQGSLFVNLSPDRLGVDIASYDAQKIMGPKGVGVLYKHSAVSLAPFIRGGSQERKIRPGTPNVYGAVGMARALELAVQKRKDVTPKVEKVREYAIQELQKRVPNVVINGGVKKRIANNINISIPGTDGDYLAVLMDSHGVSISPRSACIASGELSHSVQSLGKSDEEARGTIRFSFAPWVSRGDIDFAISALERSLAVIDSK